MRSTTISLRTFFILFVLICGCQKKIVPSFVSSEDENLIRGGGSSFLAPVMHQWISDYSAQTGAKTKITYQDLGSVEGIRKLEEKTLNFAVSNMPLTNFELNEQGLIQFPIIISGIVMVINVSGILPGELLLDAPTIANIYNGNIALWDDNQIRALNPTLKLPHQKIKLVTRSDMCGTTFNFTYYLKHASSSNWKEGAGAAFLWPKEGLSGEGSKNIVPIILKTPGSIGYIEYPHVLPNHLTWTRLKNAEGQIVPLIAQQDLENTQKVARAFYDSFQSAAEHTKWDDDAQNTALALLNQRGAASWPLTASAFIFIPKTAQNIQTKQEIFKLFDFIFKKDAQVAVALDYIPIPEIFYKVIESKWRIF